MRRSMFAFMLLFPTLGFLAPPTAGRAAMPTSPPSTAYDFDFVAIDDPHAANAEQGQILQHFIANGSRADDSHLGGAQAILVPPVDQSETRVAVGVVEDEYVGHSIWDWGFGIWDWSR